MRLILRTPQHQNMTTAASSRKWIFPVTEFRIISKLIRTSHMLPFHIAFKQISSFQKKIKIKNLKTSLEEMFRMK